MTDTTHVELTGPLVVDPVAVLQAVADPVRWAVLTMLVEAPRCVCKIQEQIPIAGNLLSYHLKVLREAGSGHHEPARPVGRLALAHDAPERMHAALPGAPVAVTA